VEEQTKKLNDLLGAPAEITANALTVTDNVERQLRLVAANAAQTVNVVPIANVEIIAIAHLATLLLPRRESVEETANVDHHVLALPSAHATASPLLEILHLSLKLKHGLMDSRL